MKDAAYEVYSKRCNGDMICTLRTLGKLDLPSIPEKTVYDWRDRYDWRGKLAAEKRAIAPHSWELYFGGLAVAAPEAVTYLRSVVTNPDASDRDRIAASRVLLGQVVAHIGQLEALMPKPAEDGPSLSDLSTEELVALASSAAEGE